MYLSGITRFPHLSYLPTVIVRKATSKASLRRDLYQKEHLYGKVFLTIKVHLSGVSSLEFPSRVTASVKRGRGVADKKGEVAGGLPHLQG